MITFKSTKAFTFKTEKGSLLVSHGQADNKPAFVLEIKSDDGEVHHKILLSEQAGMAIAGLIQLAYASPVVSQQADFEMEQA